MGFGTLFLGYFIFINLSFFEYTDLVGAMIVLTGLARLSEWNRPFRIAMYLTGVFALIGAGELFFSVGTLFGLSEALSASALDVISPIRHAMLGALTVSMLLGIRSLAREVGLAKLKDRIDMTITLPLLSYGLLATLDLTALFGRGEDTASLYIGIAALLLTLLSMILNLFTVYQAYMYICMPEDLTMPRKPSPFAFVNRMRERADAREKENIESEIQRRKEKLQRKKRKK